jgi:NADP-dependent 3-hydroxy acid dehydrogenase YdfG
MTHAMTQATRTHLVTGAGSGIGEMIADRLHQRGDRLVLLARSGDRADHLADRFPGCATVVADLADHEALVDLGGPDALDTLVHAAGVVDLAPVAEVDWHHWRQQLDVNLTAPAMLTQALLPALRAARGTVVFVNSGAGLNAEPHWAGYAASKFGLRALADALRAEEAEHGVRVSSVYPGRTATPMQQKVHEQEGRQYDADEWIRPETVADAILHVLDLPPDATVSDLRVQPT